MKESPGLFLFFALRRLEPLFPVGKLYRVLRPFAFARARFVKRMRQAMPAPAFLGPGKTFQVTRERKGMEYLNFALEFLPDRLLTAKWQERCRIDGLDRLQRARKSKRGVVLAFCHFGPYFLLRFWLRAAGVPAMTLIQGTADERSRAKRMADRLTPFPEIPTAFYQDQLREAFRFLAGGNPLLLALDGSAGRQMQAPLDDGWRFHMAAGPIRIAAHQDAELIPCCILDDGEWRFRIEIGRPVPGELLADEANWPLAGKFLLEQMIPHFRADPGQSLKRLIVRFHQASAENPAHDSNVSDLADNAAAR